MIFLQAVPARRSLAKQAAVHARRQDKLRRQRDLRELGGRHLRPVRPRGRQLPQLRGVLRRHQKQTQKTGMIKLDIRYFTIDIYIVHLTIHKYPRYAERSFIVSTGAGNLV